MQELPQTTYAILSVGAHNRTEPPNVYGEFGDDFEELFELLELLIRTDKYTDEHKLVQQAAFLRGNALELYSPLCDATKLCDAHRTAFHPPAKLVSSEELHNRKQKPFQSIATFARDLQGLGRAAYPMEARKVMLRGFFLLGAIPEIQERLTILSKPVLFIEEAITEVKRQMPYWLGNRKNERKPPLMIDCRVRLT